MNHEVVSSNSRICEDMLNNNYCMNKHTQCHCVCKSVSHTVCILKTLYVIKALFVGVPSIAKDEEL